MPTAPASDGATRKGEFDVSEETEKQELERLRALTTRLLCENIRYRTHYAVLEQGLKRAREQAALVQNELEKLQLMQLIARSDKPLDTLEPGMPKGEELETYDALAWTQAFLREVKDGTAVNEHLMMHWFTSAMMRGFDEATRRILLGQLKLSTPPAFSRTDDTQLSEHDLQGAEQCTASHQDGQGRPLGQCARCRKCGEWVRPDEVTKPCVGITMKEMIATMEKMSPHA